MGQAAATPQSSPTWHLLAVLVICVLAGVIYSNTLDVPFQFDGQVNIERNPHVQARSMDLDSLREAALQSPLPTRPLANISFALNHYFSGLAVGPYHLVNILVHTLNGLLVYLLAYLTFRFAASDKTSTRHLELMLAALVAAGIFVAHPVQTQSVTYIIQRMNSMAALFYLSALLMYIGARRGSFSNTARFGMAGGCIVMWLCALGSKETAVTLPFSIFLYEWYFFQDADFRWLKRGTLLLVPVLILMAGIAMLYLGSNPVEEILAQYQGRDFTLGERLLTQPRVIMFYVSLLILPLPSRMNFNHDFSLSYSLTEPLTTLFAIIALGLVFAWGVIYSRKYRLVSFCIIWFFLHLAVESSVISLEIIYEHRLYLPMVAPALAGGLTYLQFSTRYRRTVPALACVVVILLGWNAHVRNNVWVSSESLWSDVVSKAPGNARAQFNLGSALLELERLDEAAQHLRLAIDIKPDYGEAYLNLGNVLKKGGDTLAAIQQYETALRYMQDNALLHYNLAHALSQLRRYPEAIQSYLQSIEIAPGFLPAQFNLAELYEVQGEDDRAIDHFEASIRADPSFAPAYEKIGDIQHSRGNNQAAAEQYASALVVDAGHYAARVKLASLYLQSGRVENACILMKNLPPVSQQTSLQAAIDRFNEVCREEWGVR